MDVEFNALVEKFKNLDTKSKKEELIKEFKMNIAAVEQMNTLLKIDHKLLVNKELLDVDKSTATEDDYLEAFFVYLQMLTDSFKAFAERVSLDFYE